MLFTKVYFKDPIRSSNIEICKKKKRKVVNVCNIFGIKLNIVTFVVCNTKASTLNIDLTMACWNTQNSENCL